MSTSALFMMLNSSTYFNYCNLGAHSGTQAIANLKIHLKCTTKLQNGQDIVHISPLRGLGFNQPTSKFSNIVHKNTTHPPQMLNKASEMDKQCAQSTTHSIANLKSTSNAQQSFKMDTTLCTSALFMALSFTQTSFVKVREDSTPEAIANLKPPTIAIKILKKGSGGHSLTIAQIALTSTQLRASHPTLRLRSFH